MTIGEFAALSGLSAKALRFYDEKGLLAPRDVDPTTGYRRYGAGQVRRAATIKLLRDMGMPLAQVREAVDRPDESDRIVADFRARVAADRERQDRAMRVAETFLPAYENGAPAQRRRAARQAWAGVAMTLDLDRLGSDDGAGVAEANDTADDSFGELYGALAQRGLTPTGPFWSTLGAAGVGPEQILLCWPIPDPGDALADLTDLGGNRVVNGVLDEREEMFARCDVGDDVAESGAALPGVVAFMEAVEDLGVEDREVRQVGVLGPDGVPVAMELTVTL